MIHKPLAFFTVLVLGVAAFASGTPPPVSYSALFGQSVPGQPGWTNTFQINALPVGYGCTSVTVTLDQVSWTRNYAVSNRTETDETVTFDADPSWVGFVLRGPDGNVYASHVDPVPSYDLFVPSMSRVYGTQSADPYAHSATFTFGVPAGSFESATAPLPQQVWTMQFIEHFERPTTELPYNTRTSEWAHANITFNH